MLNDSVNAFAEVDESDYDSEEEVKDKTPGQVRKSFGKSNRRSMGKTNRASVTSGDGPDSAGLTGSRESMPK